MRRILKPIQQFHRCCSSIRLPLHTRRQSSSFASFSTTNDSSNVNPFTGKERKVKASVEKGHFWEIKDLKENKGRVFNASCDIPEEESVFNFDLIGTNGRVNNLADEEVNLNFSVDGNKYGLTLVCVSFKQFGFEMLPKWIGPMETVAAEQPQPRGRGNNCEDSVLKIRQIAFSPPGIFRIFSPLITGSLKKSIPESRHNSSFMIFQETDALNESVSITNTLTGYVFLVDDSSGKILFRGSGEPNENDLMMLKNCAKEEISTRAEKIEELKLLSKSENDQSENTRRGRRERGKRKKKR